MINNSKITEFIKLESKGWSKLEISSLILILALILLSALSLKDSPIAVVSAVCGCIYTIMAGKGKISCYLFGLCGSSCYSYLAFANALYGNLMLYLLYYIPMEILGIFKWKNNLKSETNEIIKTQLSTKQRILISLVTIVALFFTVLLLKHFGGSQPYKDAFTTVLSVVGMYLTVKRCIEQWLIWIVVNGVALFMWINIVMNGTKAYATVLMWAFYFIASIYFYIKWREEISTQKST